MGRARGGQPARGRSRSRSRERYEDAGAGGGKHGGRGRRGGKGGKRGGAAPAAIMRDTRDAPPPRGEGVRTQRTPLTFTRGGGSGGGGEKGRGKGRGKGAPAPPAASHATPTGSLVDRTTVPPFLGRVFVRTTHVPLDVDARRARRMRDRHERHLLHRLFPITPHLPRDALERVLVPDVATPAGESEAGEVQVHTWLDATLKEVLKFVLKTRPGLNDSTAIHAFHVGIITVREVRGRLELDLRSLGHVLPDDDWTRPDGSADKTMAKLGESGFSIGDFLVVGVEKYGADEKPAAATGTGAAAAADSPAPATQGLPATPPWNASAARGRSGSSAEWHERRNAQTPTPSPPRSGSESTHSHRSGGGDDVAMEPGEPTHNDTTPAAAAAATPSRREHSRSGSPPASSA